MRTIHKIVLAAAGSLAFAGAAVAAEKDIHLLKVMLPDGSVQHISYRGDAAPTLIVVPARAAFAPLAWDDADLFRPFAMFDRIMADMDRQADAMLRQAAALSEQNGTTTDGRIDLAAARNLPPGTISYSFTSISNGAATCSRSVQLTSLGPDQAPKIVSQSKGDCANAPDPATPHTAAAKPASPTTGDLHSTV